MKSLLLGIMLLSNYADEVDSAYNTEQDDDQYIFQLNEEDYYPVFTLELNEIDMDSTDTYTNLFNDMSSPS